MMSASQRITFKSLIIIFGVTIISSLCCIVFGESSLVGINVALLFLTLCTFSPLIYRSKKKNFNLFEPIYAFTLIFAVIYIFSSIYVYNREDLYTTSLVVDIYRTKEVVPIIYILGISILLLHLSYNYITKRKCSIKSYRFEMPTSQTLKRWMFILYFISISFRIFGYSIGAMGSLTQDKGLEFPGASILYFITNIWYVYFAYFTSYYFFNNKYRTFWVFAVVFEVFIVLISGDRRYIIQIVMIIMATYYLKYHTLPWKKLAILGAIFAFIFLPITTLYGYYLSTVSEGISANLDLIGSVISMMYEMDLSDVLTHFVLNPIAETLFILPTCQISYTCYDLRGISWGPVGLINLINNILPSFFIDRIDSRYYYEVFASDALSYSVEYSPLTFQFTTENIICFGLAYLPLCFFILGLFIGFLYKKLYFGSAFSTILYNALYFALCYSTQFGFLTTELITPLRLILYYFIIKAFLGGKKSKKCKQTVALSKG